MERALSSTFNCSNNWCILTDWNPSEEGFSMLQYKPTDTEIISLDNLPIPEMGNQICQEMSKWFSEITITESHMLKWISVSEACRIARLNVLNSSVIWFCFETNTYLKQLKVERSPLNLIPATLHHLPNLERVEFLATAIVSIDFSMFCTLQKLERVDVCNGKLAHLFGPTAATECSKSGLEQIYLNRNRLRHINFDIFSPFTKLILLHLNSNEIENLTGQLTNPQMKSLQLAHSYLKVVDFCGWTGSKLPELILAFNNLTRGPGCLYNILAGTYNANKWAELFHR